MVQQQKLFIPPEQASLPQAPPRDRTEWVGLVALTCEMNLSLLKQDIHAWGSKKEIKKEIDHQQKKS